MLVLSRKINQSIVIGDNIEIMLVDIRGDQIKLGINAPKTVKIFRKEVYEEVENQNREAAKSTIEELNILSSFVKNKLENNK
ncbi:carbon storage regulator CsrA [Brachyspira catarrhinii]|uniref:Translational regulator CsrA n=1 Tax=Brachyspira catarrhinii TaxID=2528966 RepID=A0ABY2TTG0_9SPIR|nr:carbon storage regulator CsrA [Brachyspira catarrhinii]TKZ35172.1 carbon storage regulator [Brachyspira catarrhinii]